VFQRWIYIAKCFISIGNVVMLSTVYFFGGEGEGGGLKRSIDMVTPCINNIQHFNFQLMHTTLKKLRVIKTF